MLNRKGFIFWAGFLALLVCVIYPPYHRVHWEKGQRYESDVHYESIFERTFNDDGPMSPIYKLDVPRFSIQAAAIILLTLAGNKAASKKNSKKRSDRLKSDA
jgi:hypothetical protein